MDNLFPKYKTKNKKKHMLSYKFNKIDIFPEKKSLTPWKLSTDTLHL